jgi:N-acetylglucosaminyldiphosphoundecaprenol N-acetyl-beta-D-mannosaminyltransferase
MHPQIKPDTIAVGFQGGSILSRRREALTLLVRRAGLVDMGRVGVLGTDSTRQRVDVGGCPIDALDMRTTVERCIELIEDRSAHRQVSVNAAKVVECTKNERLARFVRESEIVSADGQSVVWASRLLGTPLPERVPGIDLMHELLGEAERRGYGIYVLGAREEVLGRALVRMRDLYPGLRIAGSHHGYFGAEDEPGLAAAIRGAAPDLLFVAMSSPRKEEWLDRNLGDLGVRFAMGVGGAIDVLAGERGRAPAWMQRAGLEWLYRMLQEPQRMWRRYLVGNLRFTRLVASQRFARLRPREGHGGQV